MQLTYHNICTFLFNIYCTYLSITLYLSNRTNYECTQEQVEAMFSIMEKRLLEVKGRFATKKENEDTFSFGRKAE